MDLTARVEKDKRFAFRNGGGPQKSEAEEIAGKIQYHAQEKEKASCHVIQYT